MQNLSIRNLEVIRLKTLKLQNTLVIDRSDPIINLLWLGYGISVEVLIHFLGIDWVEENIFQGHKKETFLRTNFNNYRAKDDSIRFLTRVIDFGEMLFNLQYVDEVSRHIEELKSKSGQPDQIESVIAELFIAKQLFLHGMNFKFIVPTDIENSRNSYDIEVKVNDYTWACCEIKRKIETTGLSQATILNSLKGASKQGVKTRYAQNLSRCKVL